MNLVPKLAMLPGKVDVTDLRWALLEHPELWDQNQARTQSLASPHREMSDIWVRYAGEKITNGLHESRWLDAARVLPVEGICQQLLRFVGARELGGVLITRQPAGKTCYPHIDGGKGSWHADYYEKLGVSIESGPGQKFHVEELAIEPRPGQVWYFNNWYEHWVTNDTPFDRITLIVCFKRDQDLHTHESDKDVNMNYQRGEGNAALGA